MTIEASKGRRVYRCRPRARASAPCPAPAQAPQPALDAYIEELILPYIEDLEFSAAERGRTIETALRELEAAEAELDSFQTVVRGIEPEFIAAGIRSRVEVVKEKRRKLAEARLAAGPLPETGALRDRWPAMSVDERRHVLRGAIGAIFVRKGRGIGPERIKCLRAVSSPMTFPATVAGGASSPARSSGSTTCQARSGREAQRTSPTRRTASRRRFSAP
jgi:hypothetical protein